MTIAERLKKIPKRYRKMEVTKDGMLTMYTVVFKLIFEQTRSKAKTEKGKKQAVYKFVIKSLKASLKTSLILVMFLWGCGEAGPAGPAGTPGRNGADGSSCHVTQVTPDVVAPYGGALIECGASSVLVLNGEPGPQGEPGPVSPYQLSEVIDPCGDAPGIYDEVILRLNSGKLLASFSDNASGLNTHLAELPVGSYVTTDGSNCYFSVNADGSVTW